jgi:hypothetical protein
MDIHRALREHESQGHIDLLVYTHQFALRKQRLLLREVQGHPVSHLDPFFSDGLNAAIGECQTLLRELEPLVSEDTHIQERFISVLMRRIITLTIARER